MAAPDLTNLLNAALAGRYTLQRELGRGGMATVFLAEDLKHHRAAAIKVLDPELAAVLGPERFLREIEIAARLQHPHILTLLDSGVAGSLLYYVMPYVAGESLRERLTREKQLPVEEALRLTRDVAEALDFAHAQGFVHRDIKPENILLSAGQAVLADFGIARAIRAAGGTKLTETGATLGTPTYMSPEQVIGSEEIDGRSDLYGLGCVLYEMLGGQPPFTGATAESVIHQHLAAEPPRVTALRPAIPESIERALTKVLAKAPADRFKTASQFIDALALPLPATLQAPKAPGPRAVVRRRSMFPAIVAGVILLIAATAIAGWKGFGPLSALFGGRAAVDAGKKELVLVAEFDGPPDSPELATAAHDLLSTALDQSGIVATVPSEELKTALKQAGKPDTTRIDAALARELAYRRSVRAVVVGRINRVGKGYTIALRVVDVDSSKTVLSLSEVAANDEALIPSMSRLARKLRTGLGERMSEIRAARPLVDVLTPSFEAYRKFLRARDIAGEEGDARGSIAMFREALALDPDFAMAWMNIGIGYANMGRADSAEAAFGEALRREDRLLERSRIQIEAAIAGLKNDLPAAMSAYDRMLRLNLTPSAASAAYNNRGNVLWAAGKQEEAIESYKRAIELAPFGPRQVHLMNLASSLYQMGRLDETRTMLKGFKNPRVKQFYELKLAASGNDWAVAESLGGAIQEDQTADSYLRSVAAITAASGETARGAVRASALRLRRAQTTLTRAKDYNVWPWWEEVMLATFSGHVVPPFCSAAAPESALNSIINKSLWAAAAGDTVLARNLLRAIRGRRLSEDDRAWTALTEGWIAARGSYWSEVVRLLGAMAGPENKPGSADMETVRVPMRWLVADAHEGMGQSDSAAAVLELVVKRRTDDIAFEQGIGLPFAHRRLVLLYARMGRIADARRHWEVLSETFTRPDEDMVPLLEEARVALASAEGMAGSARR